jgi:two-component system cell cycle response regulator
MDMRPLASSRLAELPLLALTGVLALLAAAYTLGAGDGLLHALNQGVYNNVMLAAGAACVVRGARHERDRAAWLALGLAVLAWGAGNTVWSFTVAYLPDPPFPSYADIGFLAVYPFAYVAIFLLLRSRTGRLRPSLWLDGVIAGLAVAAVGTAVVLQAVLNALGGSRSAVATNIVYPLADLTLIGFVIWALAATGWRPGRTWSLVAAGLLVFALSDCFYLYQTAVGSYHFGSPTDLGWVAGGVLLAWAAWQPDEERQAGTIEGWPLVVAPVCFGLVALGVLVYDHFSRLNPLSLALATAAILAVLARMALTFAENMRIIARTREEADTDGLTGLLNHRRLLADLEHALRGDGQRVLAVFDLNGFKAYNDTYGHLAGDELLGGLGRGLAEAVGPSGTAYRMGGDEFCALFDGGAETTAFAVASAERALRHEGSGIGAAVGTVLVPDEARTLVDALRLADARMYAQKQRGRVLAAG